MLSNKGPLPWFEFEFAKPKGVTEYMVAVRESMGGDNFIEFNTVKTQGMQIVTVGTFSKENQKWLDLAIKEKERAEKEKALIKVKEVVIKSVEPKGWRER